MNKGLLLFFGYGASILKIMSFVPEAYEVMNTNNTKELSLGMYICLVGRGTC